jgi:DNA-binding CsgD family transcriptional regulator
MNTIKSIKNIPVTAREVDVVACLICTRGAKRVGAILDISYLTVETHIRNIFTKFSCNSQASIEHFVETADEVAWLRNHYIELLGLYYLRQKLAQMAPQIEKFKIGFCVDDDNKEALGEVAKYLKIAKVAAFDKKTTPSSKEEIRVLKQQDVLALEGKEDFKDVIFICKD